MSFEKERAKAAAQATAFLREHADRTPAEQAALDAIRSRMWILWHADDRDLGVILVLSRAGLLRDPAREKRETEAGAAMGRITERARSADKAAMGRYRALLGEAAAQLEDGADPAQVAELIRSVRDAIDNRREKDRRED